MARSPREGTSIVPLDPDIEAARDQREGAARDVLIAERQQADARQVALQALATQMAYDGDLTPAALIEGVRHYQRRTVEDCLALGVRLLLLREMTPHGEWAGLLLRLGFAERTARRFIHAARKTAKSANLADLARRQGSVGRMLELLVLDDDEAEILLDGGQIGQMTLDDVDAMPPSELRRALREARADGAAKDRVLADKSAAIDRKDTELAKAKAKATHHTAHADPDDIRRGIERDVLDRSASILVQGLPDLRLALDALRDHTGDDIPCIDLIRARVGSLLAAVQDIAADYGAEDRDADGSTGSVAGRWAAFEEWDQARTEPVADDTDDADDPRVIDGVYTPLPGDRP